MGKLISVKSFPKIFLDCGNNTFLEDPANNTLFVISSLLHVMNVRLPIENAPQTIITFSEDRENPICYRDSGLIILTANPKVWNQLSYQLAHEMCHRIISNDVMPNLRWLEESICELSSYYFLPRLTIYWRRNKIPFTVEKTKKPYYLEFEQYAKRDQEKATSFDLRSLASDDPSDDLQMLIADCEIRSKNAHIANSMLPIFKKHPDTWHAVPLLGLLSPNLPLQDSLTEWITCAPTESRIGLQKVVNLFGAEVPLP